VKLESIVQRLKQEKNLDGKMTSDLYRHLYQVILQIIQYHQYDGWDKFEQVSNTVKRTNLMIKDPKFDYEINSGSMARKRNRRTR